MPSKKELLDRIEKLQKKTDRLEMELAAKNNELEESIYTEMDLRQKLETMLQKVTELQNDMGRSQKFSTELLFRKLYEVIDIMHMASYSYRMVPEHQDIADGMDKIIDMINNVFAQYGIEPVARIKDKFDPRYHEAISLLERPDWPKNAIVGIIDQKFNRHGRPDGHKPQDAPKVAVTPG